MHLNIFFAKKKFLPNQIIKNEHLINLFYTLFPIELQLHEWIIYYSNNCVHDDESIFQSKNIFFLLNYLSKKSSMQVATTYPTVMKTSFSLKVCWLALFSVSFGKLSISIQKVKLRLISIWCYFRST